MPTLDELFADAVRRHEAGDLAAAAAIYRRVLQARPHHADSLQLLGVLTHQQGQHAAAVDFFRRAIALNGSNAAYHSNFALTLRALDRLQEAAEELRMAVRINPAYLPGQRHLAVVLTELNQLDDAATQWREVLAAQPRDAAAFKSLGLVRIRQGRLQEAAEALTAYCALKPDAVDGFNNLGVVLRDMGRPGEAERRLRRALALNPKHHEAHNNLALALADLGRLDDAVEHLRHAVQLAPDYELGHSNLGVMLKRLGRFPEAVEHFSKALALNPNSVPAHNNLGEMYNQLGRNDAALTHLRRALDIDPRCFEAHNNLALALKEPEQADEAISHLRQALELNPRYLPALVNLGNALVARNEVSPALIHYQRALVLDANSVPAFYALASTGKHTFAEADITRFRELASRPDLGPDDRSLIHFALGLVLDKQGSADDAFFHMRQANYLKKEAYRRRGQDFDPAAHKQRVDRLIEVFRAELFARLRPLGNDSDLPVFVVGMPRSGTTLVEQILASHPEVFGAGELSDIERLVADLHVGQAFQPSMADENARPTYPECVEHLTADAIRRLADTHLERLRRLGGSARRVVDKMTVNFLHLGLIAVLFPKARIVHAIRDPRDSCLSCYFHNFAGPGLNFTNALDDLAFYYRQYERIMAHWRQVLPLAMHEIVYEELVEKQAEESRALIAFCGLDWDARCLAFHENKRLVKTASNLQVREPIYKRSVARWTKYEAHLAPLLGLVRDA